MKLWPTQSPSLPNLPISVCYNLLRIQNQEFTAYKSTIIIIVVMLHFTGRFTLTTIPLDFFCKCNRLLFLLTFLVIAAIFKGPTSFLSNSFSHPLAVYCIFFLMFMHGNEDIKWNGLLYARAFSFFLLFFTFLQQNKELLDSHSLKNNLHRQFGHM